MPKPLGWSAEVRRQPKGRFSDGDAACPLGMGLRWRWTDWRHWKLVVKR